MILHYHHFGEGAPLFIVHGVFGMSDNWLTLGKKWAEHYSVYLIDARNHGHSPHADSMSYREMADDLAELAEHLGLDKINMLGHSMGGKIAMTLAIHHPDLVEKLIVVDIGPKGYPLHHQAIIKGLTELNNTHLTSRREADELLGQWVQEWGVRQFLLKNLYWKEKGVLGFRMNVPVIAEHMPQIVQEVDQVQVDTPTMFVRGLKSKYIEDDDIVYIHDLYPNSTVVDVEDSGHWVHAEQPAFLYQQVITFLDS